MMSETVGPRVVIVIGSDSDLPVMASAAAVLKRLGVDFELHVASAHRSPARTVELVRSAEARGVRVFVAAAGGAAHLAGTVAAHTTRPVLGVPLAASDLGGLDSLLATVQMPAGVPVGTLAIGKPGAANAAWLAAGILALDDEALARRLRQEREALAAAIPAKSEAAQRKLDDLIG
jgi:5-(carboxyamino)imidazole ribonucleotide mutase